MAYCGPPSASGFNPRWGRDEGVQPPHAGGYAAQPCAYGAAEPQAAPWWWYYYPPGAYAPAAGLVVPPPPPPAAVPAYVSGMGGGTRHPQAYPIVDSDLPAANMTNSTGGVGCEPGYNYFFAGEHTKVHVFKTGPTPPWELPRRESMPFHACHIPVNTTVGDLLRGMGANNPAAKKNRVCEVVQGGNGKWYKGIGFSGDDAAAMAKTLKEVGWDSSRTGQPGGKPVVYLYITKD